MQQPPEPNTPPQYAAYPRGSAFTYGSADRFRSLVDGYFGLNRVFLINLLFLVIAIVIEVTVPFGVLFALPALMIATGFVAYPMTKKIGYGMNWSPSGAVGTAILIGVLSFVCFGALGFVIVQMIAAGELKRYGLTGSAFGGIKKTDAMRMVAEMEAQANSASFIAPPPA